MRILHVLSQRPEATGSGVYIRAMIAAAIRRGHESFLLAGVPGPRPPAIPELPPERCRFVHFGGPDLPFDVVGMSDVMPYDSCRFRDLTPAEVDAYHAAFDRRLQEALAAFRPDLIHSHHLWLLSARVRRLCPDLPVVTSCHGTDLRQFQNCAHLRPLLVDACRRIDAVLALSEIQKSEIAQLYDIAPGRIHVVGAGYDAGRFHPAPKPPPKPVRVLYAGKLCRAKGVVHLLRALGRIAEPDWRLELVGGGSGAEKQEVLAQARDLGERVIVTGLIDQAALAERMRRAHIFVLSSFYEGLPLVLLEALASGCRLVATALPGVQELFAGLQDPAVRQVALPAMAGIDRPTETGKGDFEARMAEALREQMNAALRAPDPDLTPFRPLLERFTWEGVHRSVAAVYDTLRDARRVL